MKAVRAALGLLIPRSEALTNNAFRERPFRIRIRTKMYDRRIRTFANARCKVQTAHVAAAIMDETKVPFDKKLRELVTELFGNIDTKAVPKREQFELARERLAVMLSE